MNVLIIDNGTKHLGRLKDLLFGNEIVVQKLFSKYENIDSFDLIVLSGGSQISITAAPEIFREEINLVKESKKPIIGICEGCEIIAYAYNSTLDFNERKSKGLKRIEATNDDNLLKGLERIEVYEAHHWAITCLGEKLVGLAKSQTGYEIIKHKTKNVYGLQFHPEMLANESVGEEIFRKIVVRLTGEPEFEVG